MYLINLFDLMDKKKKKNRDTVVTVKFMTVNYYCVVFNSYARIFNVTM